MGQEIVHNCHGHAGSRRVSSLAQQITHAFQHELVQTLWRQTITPTKVGHMPPKKPQQTVTVIIHYNHVQDQARRIASPIHTVTTKVMEAHQLGIEHIVATARPYG